MKIERLTPEQEAAVVAERKRYFDLAASTAPADRHKAEAAARELADLVGVKVNCVVWVNSPQDGGAAHDAEWDSLGDSPWNSRWDPLRGSPWGSLAGSLGGSLGAFLWDSLWNSLGASLWGLLWASSEGSLRASLEDSTWASLRDAGGVAFYAVLRDIFGATYAAGASRKLGLLLATLESCFAFWLAPGTAIICERPATVEIRDGRLVRLTWRASVKEPHELEHWEAKR